MSYNHKWTGISRALFSVYILFSCELPRFLAGIVLLLELHNDQLIRLKCDMYNLISTWSKHAQWFELPQDPQRFKNVVFIYTGPLKLYHLAEYNKCIYCFKADSIEHTFIDCKESVNLYSQIISWFNHSQSTETTLSKEQIAFHDTCHVTDVLSDPLKRKLDLLIILVKQYIYVSKYLHKELSLDELVNKLMVQWKLEKCA